MYLVMLQPNSGVAPTSAIPTTFANDASKYAVADILTSFASGELATPTSLGGIFSTATSSSDLLTPTTLANWEQTLISLQADDTSSTISLPRESGFVPPIIIPGASTSSTMVKQEEYDYLYDDDESSQDLDDWMPEHKRQRFDDPGSVMMQQYNPNTSKTRTPNRRRRLDDTNLTSEEADRRNVRRERNKVAAAKCRQRRVDLTNKLLIESEGLEEEQSKLENEIQMLQTQKEQLAFLLEAHNPVCSAKIAPSLSTPIKSEKMDITYPSVLDASTTSSIGTSTYHTTSQAAHAMSNFSNSRPNTLRIPAKSDVSVSNCVTMATGVPITTPSSVFNFGLESMLDGHTGLTPITGAPSCASQLQRNSTDGSSSPDTLGSPTTLMAL